MPFLPDELEGYHTGFELFDPLGKLRMKDLIYTHQAERARYEEAIEFLRSSFDTQGLAIDQLAMAKIDPENKLKARIEELEKQLDYANMTIDSLVKWSNRLEEIMVENGIHLTANGHVVKESA